MKFGVITDCQYADVDIVPIAPQREFRIAKNKLEKVVEFYNSQDDIEFVVHLGDFIDHDITGIEKLNAITAELKAPLYHVLGNHDFYEEWPKESGRNDKNKLLQMLDMPASYYSKVVDDYKFLFLDTNEVGIIEWPEGSKEHQEGLELISKLKNLGYENAETWNGSISDKQLAWINEELKCAKDAEQQVIFFAHHGVFPEHRENMLEYEKILGLFNEYKNIIAYMNGHNHDGNQGVFNNVPCITYRAMLDTKENSYSIVHVKNKEIEIVGYGREDSRIVKTRG